MPKSVDTPPYRASALPLLATLIGAAMLVACPESPPDVDQAGAAPGATPGGAPAGGPAAPAANGNAPAASNGGSGAGGVAPELDPEMENPQHSQEDLVNDTEAVTVRGSLICDDGDGPYRLRLFVPPPDQGGPETTEEEAGPPSPLINVELKDAGAFSFRTPPGEALVVLAYEDLDGNGLPTLEEPQFGPLDGNPMPFTADVTGLALDCSKPLPAPEPRMDTVTPAGNEDAPSDGPPVDEVPAANDGPPPVEGDLPPPMEGGGAPPGDAPAGGPPPE